MNQDSTGKEAPVEHGNKGETMKRRVLHLLVGDIVIVIDETGGCSLTSRLHEDAEDDELWQTALDMLESIVLAHASAGVDIEGAAYQTGLRTALEAAAQNIPEPEDLEEP